MNFGIVNQQSVKTVRAARKLVMSIVEARKAPMTIQEIYDDVVKKESAIHETPAMERPSGPTPVPPYPEHLIKSMKYLKKVILPSLAETDHLEKVHTTHQLTEEEVSQRRPTTMKASRKRQAATTTTFDLWRWRLKPEMPGAQPPAPVEVYGTEVGADEDFSHLNKRRRTSREATVQREIRWMQKLQKVKEVARRDATQEASLSSDS